MKIFQKLIIILSLGISAGACKTNDTVKVEDFTVNMNSPQTSIGEIELQFETMMGLGGIKKQNVDVLYFPREEVVCLKYKYEFYTYHQFWDRKGRLLFINALQKYNDDYDERNLQRNLNKSQSKYGTVRGYLIWQQLSFTVQAHANMNIDLGYTFKDKSPYFIVYQRDTEYIDNRARDNNRISPNVTMYFTRAQAAVLSDLFEQYIIPDYSLSDDYEEANIPTKKDDIPRDNY
jgi:hypothetical protein